MLSQTPAIASLPTLSPLSSTTKTLAQPLHHSGIGLHSGATVQVQVQPALPGTGRVFRRTDLPGTPTIAAHWRNLGSTTLSTELVEGEAKIRTVEHLLAALAGLGVTDALIDIDGPEVPLLDGSALGWLEAIAAAGLVDQAVDQAPGLGVMAQPDLQQLVHLQDGDAFVSAFPAPYLRLSYGIDFAVPTIGNQWASFELTPATFAQEIAPARTFGLAEQVEQLRSLGLIRGGSLDNALVCSPTGWLNGPLRFANEPARHKLLDLVGDLSLLGYWPKAHILAYKASHRLHTQFAKLLHERLYEPLVRDDNLLPTNALYAG